MRGAYAFSTGLRRRAGAVALGWERGFDSNSGALSSLILDYSGAVGGQFYDGTSNTLDFDDIHTFTRASLATQKGTAGLVKFVPHNLTVQSEALNLNWNLAGTTISVNAITAPDGTMSGDKIVETASNSAHIIWKIVAVTGVPYQFSAYMKAGGRTWGYISFDAGASKLAFFDLDNGVEGTIDGSYSSSSITSVGDGWYKCTVTVAAASSSWIVSVGSSTGDTVNSFTGDVTKGIYAWGTQLNNTPMALANDTFVDTYVPTTSAVVYQHRLDHDKDGNRIGLLIEEARTNETPDSNSFDGGDWLPLNITQVDDSGSTTGVIAGVPVWKVTPTTSNDLAKKYFGSGSSFTPTGSSSVTVSAFFKYHSHQWVQLSAAFAHAATNNAFQNFDILNGVVGDNEADVTNAQMEDWGNGWYRCWFVYTTKGSPTASAPMGVSMSDSASESKLGPTTSTNSYFIQGAQAEDAVTFPSTYIPTTTVPVTRAAETAPVLVSTYAYSATLGSVSAVLTPNNTPTAELVLVSFNDTTANEVIQIVADSSANVDFDVEDGGVGQASIDSLVNAVGGTELKVAASWKVNDFAISVNGATIAVDTGGTLPTLTTIDPCASGHTKSIVAWNVTLSDADLVAEGT